MVRSKEIKKKVDLSLPDVTSNEMATFIYSVRGMQVILDSDLAKLYQVETKMLNRAVKRNIERFPEDFRFQLTEPEWNYLRFQNGTSIENGQNLYRNANSRGGRRYLPFVFTEEGVAGLSGVLKSEIAAKTHVTIMRAFVTMRKIIRNDAIIFHRLDSVEKKQIESDGKIESIFKAIEEKSLLKTQGIFFDQQIYDAFSFIIKLIQKAKQSIVLIDGYVNIEVLDMLSKKEKNVNVKVFTYPNAEITKTDISRFNAQYPQIQVRRTTKVHDRFLIIDGKELYAIGASIKDLGKKCFSFMLMQDLALIEQLIKRLEE